MFDVTKAREQLHGPIGTRYYLDQVLEDVAALNGVTGTSDGMLGQGTRCLLVGYDDAGRELLAKTIEWLQFAISHQEVPRHYFHGGTEASRYENLALCNWLLHDRHDQESLARAVHWQNVYYEESGIDKQGLSIALPTYVDAGEYRQAVELF